MSEFFGYLALHTALITELKNKKFVTFVFLKFVNKFNFNVVLRTILSKNS